MEEKIEALEAANKLLFALVENLALRLQMLEEWAEECEDADEEETAEPLEDPAKEFVH